MKQIGIILDKLKILQKTNGILEVQNHTWLATVFWAYLHVLQNELTELDR